MNNQVFLPFTFAEIYNNTPEYLRGKDSANYRCIFIASIEYGGKPAEIWSLFDLSTETACVVLTDINGIIL